MKIAILSNTAWNVLNFRKGLVNKFIENGDTVIAMTPTDNYVVGLEKLGIRHISVQLDRSGINPARDLGYLRDLKRILGNENPDIALGFTIKPNIYGSIATHSLRIPMICNVSGLGTTFLWKAWIRLLAIRLYKYAFNKASFIFFQNADDLELFQKEVGVSTTKIGLLPGSGIDLSAFNSEPPLFEEPIKVLMIARLLIDKGVEEFCVAHHLVSDENGRVVFQLVGEFDPNHKRSINKELFEKIESSAIDYLEHTDHIQQLIKKADVLVLPSYREGTPRTLLEGAAMSRPLITTNVPGCKDVVDDGINGFICEARDANGLADKIITFLSLSRTEQTSMARASRRLVEEKYDEMIVVNTYIKKIESLLY